MRLYYLVGLKIVFFFLELNFMFLMFSMVVVIRVGFVKGSDELYVIVFIWLMVVSEILEYEVFILCVESWFGVMMVFV